MFWIILNFYYKGQIYKITLPFPSTYYLLEGREKYVKGIQWENLPANKDYREYKDYITWHEWRDDRPGVVIYKHYTKYLLFGFTEALKGPDSSGGLVPPHYPTISQHNPYYFDAETGLSFTYLGKTGEHIHNIEVKYDVSNHPNMQGVIVKTLIDSGQSLSVAINRSADIDLHAYTEDGSHVGLNYTTGEYVLNFTSGSGDIKATYE